MTTRPTDILDLVGQLDDIPGNQTARERSRRERAEAVRHEHAGFFDSYGSQAREVLDYLLDKYTEHGVAQLTDLHILEMPDVPVWGTVIEIADLFGGVDRLKDATRHLQNLIYAA